MTVGDTVVDTLTYQLGPGDVVHVEVVGEPDMSGDRRIGSDGTVDIAFAGPVAVGGLTLDQATAEITRVLGARYLTRPQVTLDILKLNSKRVELTGGVVKPGVYALSAGHTTVSDLIVRSGGLVDPATPRAEVWRDGVAGREVLPIDLESVNRGDVSADLELIAGDHLNVPPPPQVFVDGRVAKAGAYVYRDGMTITQAITNAGGFAGSARTTFVQLIRGTDHKRVNVKRILEGHENDILLRPGDQIYVPESAF